MPIYTIHHAKTQLSKLIEQALQGEEVIIAKGSHPLVKLNPLQPPKLQRTFGALKGQATVSDAFFEPLSEEDLGDWYK